ncbi:MAG: MFS transporter [Methanobacteriota archaeon]|nr:MAG: MFS transporter [Euryarchaeota archaeon]
MHPRHINLLGTAAVSASLIFIPLWAHQLGATTEVLGFIVAAYNGAVLVASYVFGRAADVHGSRKILQAGLVLGALAAFLQVFAQDPISALLTRAFLGFCVGMYPPALLAYARSADKVMGTFAAWGSLGWAAGTFLAGLSAWFAPTDTRPVFILSSGLFLAALAVSSGAPDAAAEKVVVPLFPLDLIRRNLPIYLTMLIRHTGANMVWVIFPLYLRDRLGMDGFQIALAYTLNPLVQFVVMQRIERVRSTRLVGVGLVASLATFVSFTLGRNFVEILLTQVLLGFAWATLYVGALQFLVDRNRETATAGGILSSVLSISSIVGPIAGGVLSFGDNYVIPMYAAAAMCGIAMVTYWVQLRVAPVPPLAPAARSGD